MELKRLTIQDIPATLLDANTGFAGCSHLPLRGQMTTVATKQRANFGEITPGSLRSRPTQRCCLAAQHPVLKTLLANYEFPASVLGKQLYPLSTGLLPTNLQSPLKSFPG